MRVTNFFPNELQTSQLGLVQIDMRRLGGVVVLAGRNGSGKSRTLQALRNTINLLTQYSHFDETALNEQVIGLSEILTKVPRENASYHNNELEKLKSIQELRRKTTLLGNPRISEITEFVPSSDPLTDPSNAGRAQQNSSYKNLASTIGMAEVNSMAPIYIDHIFSSRFNASHQETEMEATERQAIFDQCDTLRDLIEHLLPGASVGRDKAGNVTLFKLPIGQSNLSDGQRALLRLAVALHTQSAKLDEAILILDEPENHLHPDALVEFVDRLIKVTPNGQLWIATHSIHVLSHVEPESIWFMEEGSVSWAGRQPERVMRSLVGDEERVGRLERFLHLPSVLAMERFAAECLLPPSIATTGPEDPQSNQIRRLIERHRAEGQKLRILDYGAGRGRILATLRQSGGNIRDLIDYRAFEPDAEARRHCIGAVADAFGLDPKQAQTYVYDSEDSLRRQLNKESVDVAIMCNVLHEIHPENWCSLFKDEILGYCMKPDGYIFLLEDMEIPHGENAHKDGFILLDTEQLQTLFSVNPEDADEFAAHSDEKSERLKAHLVRADTLKRVTVSTVTSALQRRLASAGTKIEELRKGPPTFKGGHLLALYAMVYANTALALKKR